VSEKQTPVGEVPENKWYLDFKDIIKEEKEFHLKGWERIQKYYQIDDEELRYKETELKRPPHEHIKDTAKSFINLAFSSSQDLEKTTDTSGVLLGVGTELLLKAIILNNDPQWFISESKKKRTREICTPSLYKCIQKVKELLKNRLDNSQLERLDDILALISTRRNELAHLHFHKRGHYAIPYQILNVIEFLFGFYFPEDDEFIERLSELKEKNKLPDSQMDFPAVEFPRLERERKK